MSTSKIASIIADLDTHQQALGVYVAALEDTLATLVINMEKNELATVQNLHEYYMMEAKPKLDRARNALKNKEGR